MSVFVEATTPEPLGDGRYRLRYDNDWWLFRGPNGGFVAAGVVRAMEAELGMPERQLRSLTVHYPAAPREGEAIVDVRVERSGGSLSTVSARMTQGDRLEVLALGAFAGVYESAISFDHERMPDVEVPTAMPEPTDHPDATPFARRWRLEPAHGRHGEAFTAGWMEPADPTPLDAALLVGLSDTWIPAPFAIVGHFGAPTIDLTVHLRAALPRPPGPVLGEFRTGLARDGFFEEDGRLWAPDGTLLALSRQLAIAR